MRKFLHIKLASIVLLSVISCEHKETHYNVLLGQNTQDHVKHYLHKNDYKKNPFVLIMTKSSMDTCQFSGFFFWSKSSFESLTIIGHENIEGHDCFIALKGGALINTNRDVLNEINFYPKEHQVEFEVFHFTTVRDSVIYSD